MGRLWSDLGPIKTFWGISIPIKNSSKFRKQIPLWVYLNVPLTVHTRLFEVVSLNGCQTCERKLQLCNLQTSNHRMMICKRLAPPDDHLQEAGHSKWSFARSWFFSMIICKRPAPRDDYLQEAGLTEWWFAKGRPLWMIICKKLVHPWRCCCCCSKVRK